MHLPDQRILGIVILCLFGMLVIVKRVATGAILDYPKAISWFSSLISSSYLTVSRMH